MISLVILLSLAVAFTFAGVEAAVLVVNPTSLRRRARDGDPRARKVKPLLDRSSRTLLVALLSSNLGAVLALCLLTLQAVGRFGPGGYALALAGALPIWVIGLGLLPKCLFRRAPVRALALLSAPIRLGLAALAPAFAIADAFRALLPRRARQRGSSIFVAREEMKFLALEVERSGALSQVEREIIHGIIDFREVPVSQLMVPWADVPSLRRDSTFETLREIAARSDLDPIPVLGPDGDLDGMIPLFDTLLDHRPEEGIAPRIRPIVACAADESAQRALRRLRAARAPLGVVVDPRRRPLGVIRIQDLLRHMIGGSDTPRPRPDANGG